MPVSIPQMITKAVTVVDKRLESLGKTFAKSLSDKKFDVDTGRMEAVMAAMAKSMDRTAQTIDAAAKKKTEVNVTQKNDDVVRALKDTANAISKAVKANRTNTDKMEAQLATLERATNEVTDAETRVEKQVVALNETVKSLRKTLGKAFKLDDMQFRALAMAAGGGGGSSGGGGGGGGKLAGNGSIITRVSMPTADTEYSHTFSKGCVGFTLKLTSQNTKFTYAWATGKLPGSGDGTAYMTIAQNFLRSPDWLEPGGKTIYFETDTTSQTMEIEEITA